MDTPLSNLIYIYKEVMNKYRIKPTAIEKLPGGTAPIKKGQKRIFKPGALFLRGPISWKWLSLAARQKGRTLHVAIALQFLAGLNSSSTVKLSNKVLDSLGVDRFTKYRALKELEDARLISIEKHSGRSPVITILDLEYTDSGLHLEK